MKFKTSHALVAALMFAACSDESPVGAKPGDLAIKVPRGSVQAAVEQQAPAPDGSITFVVHVLSNDVTLSSYQGVVSFTPGSFDLVSSKAGRGSDEQTYFLNPADAAEGKIRFAAFTTTAFGETNTAGGVEAFRFTIKPHGDVERANIVATIDVVGRESGVAMPANLILPSTGLLRAAPVTAK